MPQRRPRITLGRVLAYFALAFIIITPIRLFVAQPFIVSGKSMVPALVPGDYLVVDELAYRMHAPERGDVIIFSYPLDPAQVFVKRIVGLPGETVQVARGRVTIVSPDKQRIALLVEPYVDSANIGKNAVTQTTTLHDDEYYVLGDDRDASSDSRVWGALSERFILGRADVRLLPLTRFMIMPGAHAFSDI